MTIKTLESSLELGDLAVDSAITATARARLGAEGLGDLWRALGLLVEARSGSRWRAVSMLRWRPARRSAAAIVVRDSPGPARVSEQRSSIARASVCARSVPNASSAAGKYSRSAERSALTWRWRVPDEAAGGPGPAPGSHRPHRMSPAISRWL